MVGRLPDRVTDLSPAERRDLASALGRGAWTSPAAAEAYAALSAVVADGSARRWRHRLRLSERRARPRCGASSGGGGHVLRARVRRRAHGARPGRQPLGLAAGVPPAPLRRRAGRRAPAAGAVDGDDRRPRGRLAPQRHRPHRGPLEPRPVRPTPEAKVYLDTPPHLVAGYWPLAWVDDRAVNAGLAQPTGQVLLGPGALPPTRCLTLHPAGVAGRHRPAAPPRKSQPPWGGRGGGAAKAQRGG